jgi:CheY-like chemotaxis protein
MTKILVVDDDPDFVLNSRAILEAEGYEVIDACNGSQALPLMRRERPDLILLDVMMSTTLEGLEVCREVRSDPDLQDVPIIMISSIASSEYASEFPEDELIPIDTWMPKPVEPVALLKAIRHFVR